MFKLIYRVGETHLSCKIFQIIYVDICLQGHGE